MIEKIFIPEVKTWKFQNGLTVVWSPRKEINSIFIDACVRFGSSYSKNPALPHFLEHLVEFSPTKNIKTKEKIHTFSNKIGLSTDAETRYYYTKYTGDTSLEFYNELLFLFKEKLFLSQLDKKTFRTEKMRIIEEINSRIDDPVIYFNDNFLSEQAKEKNSILSNPTGNIAQLNSLTYKEVIGAYKKFYNPQNMLILISGPFLLESNIKKAVNFYFGRIKKSTEAKIPIFLPTTLKKNFQKEIVRKGVKQYYFSIIFQYSPFSFEEEYKLLFLCNMLNAKGSMLQKIREAIGVYYIDIDYFILPNSVLVYIYGSTQKRTNISQVLKLIKSYFKKDINNMFTKKQFEQSKRKNIQLLLEDFEFDYQTFDFIGSYFMKTNKLLIPKERLEEIKSLTIQEIQIFLNRIFNFEKMNLFFMIPGQPE